ncbi:MAG TPA: response regulator, partial [Candidatus Hydrogenedentes bacterium]|nr:response regulator [Candidatus Hydrogenedentota bacterium]
RGLVLIAEDEPVVREWTRSILESSGFSVVAASNGEEALLQFQENADKIILALLDVVMPRRNGVDVARQISAVRPDLPVIFMTGHDFGILEGQGAEDGQSSMPQRMVTIQKPFRGGELLQKVRETLSALS